MNKNFLWAIALASFLLFSCSGNDDNASSSNPPTQSPVGTWVIKKAIYEGQTDTTFYDHSETCGREVLEFHSNNSVGETHFVDSNCMNGVGSEWQWWINGSGYAMGYNNSDTFKPFTVSETTLLVDAWEDWGYRKYYLKVE